MVRNRVRLRFGKAGELRFLGHRDLVRVWERAFRRSGLPVRRSAGFHPRLKLSFASALPVGVAGLEEVLEVELDEPLAAHAVAAAIAAHLPSDLPLGVAAEVPDAARKACVRRATYTAAVPAAGRVQLPERIANLLASPHHWIPRGPGKSLDLRAALDEVAFQDGVLQFRTAVAPEGSIRPREVLAALGLADLEIQGGWLTRTVVELET